MHHLAQAIAPRVCSIMARLRRYRRGAPCAACGGTGVHGEPDDRSGRRDGGAGATRNGAAAGGSEAIEGSGVSQARRRGISWPRMHYYIVAISADGPSMYQPYDEGGNALTPRPVNGYNFAVWILTSQCEDFGARAIRETCWAFRRDPAFLDDFMPAAARLVEDSFSQPRRDRQFTEV